MFNFAQKKKKRKRKLKLLRCHFLTYQIGKNIKIWQQTADKTVGKSDILVLMLKMSKYATIMQRFLPIYGKIIYARITHMHMPFDPCLGIYLKDRLVQKRNTHEAILHITICNSRTGKKPKYLWPGDWLKTLIQL